MEPAAKRPRFHVQSQGAEDDGVVDALARALLSEPRLRALAHIGELVDDALALAAARGIVMYKQPAQKSQASVVPVTLLPTAVDETLYVEAVKMAPAFHLLMDRIACDLPWLQRALARTGEMDEICGRLLGICSRVYGSGGCRRYEEDLRLHIMRNDFMFDYKAATACEGSGGLALRQIELNMIAASFSAHAEDLTEVHRYLLSKYLGRGGAARDSAPSSAALQRVLDRALPRSPSAAGIAAGLAAAHEAYSRRQKQPPGDRMRVVLFISDTAENNELDHRKLEAALFRDHGVVSLRRSLAQLGAQLPTLLAEASTAAGEARAPRALIVDGHEVTVAYFRSGYWPGQFGVGDDKELCWKAREAIERSDAVKCPAAPAQLAGMKKVQQLLCEPAQLARFLPDADADVRAVGGGPVAERLRRTFARQGDPSETATSAEAAACVAAALAAPEDWVLKPQVEGSGELFFGEDVPRVLQSRTPAELAEFILMERIRPPVTPSIVLAPVAQAPAAADAMATADGKAADAPEPPRALVRGSVSELGIFGVFFADGSKVMQNEAVGHLLRSKARHTNQGGVFVGNAVVDAPVLVPPGKFWPLVST
eukprot:TRINITY_DN63688_c0_g1_i1.p1 TRINITY_DN63688_c0_g1~~TRINITY_DN63688_c0_g1_i1.p1  ORF type:complete len:609 (+),score=170.63 TRINITY_DN63688_c0_g1_i1:39-1829(+)